LIPQPTDDPNDPLNWSSGKKVAALVSGGCVAYMAGWISGGPASAIPILMAEFGTNLSDTIDGLINWGILMLGLGVTPTSAKTVLMEIDLFLGPGNWVPRNAPCGVDGHSNYVRRVFLGRWFSQFWEFGGISYYFTVCCELWGGSFRDYRQGYLFPS
jgi:hypothetical protein